MTIAKKQTKKKTSTKYQLSWQVHQMRLTAFPSPDVAVAADSWWQDLIGEPPDVEVKDPKTGGRQYEGALAIGSLSPGRLVLVISPQRIDWIIQGTEHTEANMVADTLGNADQGFQEFGAFANRWFALSGCPPMQRLAFGGVLLGPVADRATNYRLLSKRIPVRIDPAGSSDFLYQINRPRRSQIELFKPTLNRLSRWSVMRRSTIRVELSGPKAQTHQQEHGSVCRLELDVNTAPDYDVVIERSRLAPIFEELVRLGKEIARKGDVR